MGFLDRFFGPPDKDRFARRVMDAIRKAGETATLRYDAEHFRLYGEGEGKHEMNLTNAYNEYCAASRDRKEIIFRNFVRTWFAYRRETPAEFEDVSHDLLPGVRNRLYFDLLGLKMRTDGEANFNWPFRVLADSLGVGLVYDLPDSMVQVQQHNLDEWKATFDEALEVACRNLQAISRRGLERVGPGVWRSPWRDNYDPSRMLLPDFLRGHEVAGDPVVMVPNRDTLLLGGSGDAAALGKLAALAEEAYKHPRSLCGGAFRLDADDQWVPFLPEEGHPHYQPFKLLWLRSVGGDYAEQQGALKALHEKTGKDVYVAGFSARKNQDSGEVRSYCVWSEGVDTFLPRTDDVVFFRPKDAEDGDIIADAPWERVQAVVGDLMKPVGLYPERYLVEDFPSEDQLAALGSEERAG